ncbi:MAG: choice-of-anchor tandem repeat GloVer-containing protein, partial [Roseimicrobium sp.]
MPFPSPALKRPALSLPLLKALSVGLLLAASTVTAEITYEVLHSFEKPGLLAQAALVLHGDGQFYGTTVRGGARNLGAVYRMAPTGTITTLFSFSGADGSSPIGTLAVGSDGALYGVTPSGGVNGFGTAFKITTEGVFTKLVDFTGSSGAARGSVPEPFVLAADGNFYGTTQAGGAHGFGTVFQMTPAGVVTALADFTGSTGSTPGAQPVGPLATSGAFLYGVTKAGGAGNGVIYEITNAGSFRLLGQFTGSSGAIPGASPAGGLLWNSDSALYGTTEYGGTNGLGVAFKLIPAATPAFTLLRHFADATGSQPVGSLVAGSDGALYGLTYAGGADTFGTAYKITTTGTHTVLAEFTGETGAVPGSAPRGGLCVGLDGQFYAVTPSGGAGNLGQAFKVSSAGSFTGLSAISLSEGWTPSGAPVLLGTSLVFPNASGGAAGGGTLTSISATGAVSTLAALGGTLGSAPDGALTSSGSTLYGITAKGAASNRGSLFRYSVAAGPALVAAYSNSAGSLAEGPVTLGADGLFWGVAREGGASSRGSVYKITTSGTRTRVVSFTGTTGAAIGAKPRGPLALASDGNFYGLCSEGGAKNTGLLFKVTPAGLYTVVSQCLDTGARLPTGGLVVGADGNLYGTMTAGGAADAGVLIRYVPGSG